jgi:hypothetical protein
MIRARSGSDRDLELTINRALERNEMFFADLPPKGEEYAQSM